MSCCSRPNLYFTNHGDAIDCRNCNSRYEKQDLLLDFIEKVSKELGSALGEELQEFYNDDYSSESFDYSWAG